MSFQNPEIIESSSSSLGLFPETTTLGGGPFAWPQNNLVYSGYTVVLPLPLGRTPNDVPTFIVRTNPSFLISKETRKNRYFDAVQFVEGTVKDDTKFKLLYKRQWNPMIANTIAHRYVSGNLGVTLRINSTGFTGGNMMVTQHNSVFRNPAFSYNFATDNKLYYSGFSCSPGLTTSSSQPVNFALNDLAISKNLTLSLPAADSNLQDLWLLNNMLEDVFALNVVRASSIAMLYSETALGVTIQTDLVSFEPGTLNIDIYLDWSAITWSYPMFPALAPASLYSENSIDILDDYLKPKNKKAK